jgi:hypothetical protein
MDAQGLAIPDEASERWRDWIGMIRDLMASRNLSEWPPRELRSLFALAQHYGVPTRLLDWTELPLVAAYFAAAETTVGALSGDMAVWALAIGQAQAVLMADLATPLQPKLAIIRPPRFPNPNLRAQDGVFTLLLDETKTREGPFSVPSLDELLRQRMQKRIDDGSHFMSLPIRKLVLPCSEAGELLELLANEWVSGTYLYPGLQGVVRGMRERAAWPTVKARLNAPS